MEHERICSKIEGVITELANEAAHNKSSNQD